jgi:pyruvate dehydrogenase E2 component (dihydrolipoamide acetyltransferase)
MPVEVILPKVDMDMESGTIEAWKVSEGETVIEGQLIFEIGTSKAVMEVEAPVSGIIRRISAKPGETIAVGTPVAWIYGVNEAVEFKTPGGRQSLVAGHAPANDAATPSVERASFSPDTDSVRATPLARRLARERGLSLADIKGTGPRGRIGEADIRAHLAQRTVPSQPSPGLTPASVAGPVRPPAESDGEHVPFSAVRRIVAQRMTESATRVPHFYLEAAMDMSPSLALMKRVTPALTAQTGAKPSLTAFIAHVVGRVLADHPLLNASVDGEATRFHAGRHIGIAMDRDGDLVVPVLRHAGAGRFAETVAAFQRLREAVENRSLKPSEMEGGTFTLSNLGMFGVDRFTAIINPPQSGILAIGRTIETPVGVGGQIVLRPMANFCLSADHRIVDGVVAARFMADLRRMLETPELLL